MDSIKMQKHQAMRNYKKAQFFFIKVVVYSLAAFLSTLFYLFLFWFPTMNHFISIYLLPNIYSLFLNSKFLFILVNIIVAILIADTKLRSYNPISPTDVIYNKDVEEKKQSLRLIKKQQSLSPTPSTNNLNKNVTGLVTVHDQVLHPLKTVKSCNTMILHDVTDSKKSMGSRTQCQRKRSKRQVNKKTTISTRDDRELDCNTITSGELVTRGDHVDNCKMISGGEIVEFGDKVINDVEQQQANSDGREEEKIEMNYYNDDILEKNELNRRADEFIARVNRRRMLEREAWTDLHRVNEISVSS